ncbi:MAG TPA: polysaccharide deacetylase family protein [Bacteroidales bacterium]|nr:polysaccharide deacetylase family protein [Bacteroidales bacterium]
MRQVPEFIKRIWRTPIWRMDSNQKAIYLTFDDGPNPEITPQVLDILDEFGVKANFFCVGENVQKYRDVFEETKRRGHKVGNHTFNHLKGFETSVEEYVENVEKANELIKSKLFRPPHGRITPRQVNALKKDYKIIMWDFITYDFDARVSPETILNEVKKRSRNGSIVVFHDLTKVAKNMLAVLPKAIQFWQDEGYELKLIE